MRLDTVTASCDPLTDPAQSTRVEEEQSRAIRCVRGWRLSRQLARATGMVMARGSWSRSSPLVTPHPQAARRSASLIAFTSASSATEPPHTLSLPRPWSTSTQAMTDWHRHRRRTFFSSQTLRPHLRRRRGETGTRGRAAAAGGCRRSSPPPSSRRAARCCGGGAAVDGSGWTAVAAALGSTEDKGRTEFPLPHHQQTAAAVATAAETAMAMAVAVAVAVAV